MKNRATDVADHLMAQLERLGDEDMRIEELEAEIKRASAIANIAREWTSLQRTAIDAAKVMHETSVLPVVFVRSLSAVDKSGQANPLAIGVE